MRLIAVVAATTSKGRLLHGGTVLLDWSNFEPQN